MTEQLDLGESFAPPPIVNPDFDASLTLRERFDRFAAANPQLEHAIVAIARDLKRRGFERCGIALIFERLRWLHAIATRGDSYKLNNSWRAFYARLVMDHHRDLAGFFETRVQRAA